MSDNNRLNKEALSRVVFRPLKFMSHVRPTGVLVRGMDPEALLPDELGAHACWYYCRSAHHSLQQLAEGGVYDGDRDPVMAINNIARSTAAFYRMESPDEFLIYLGYVRLEAARCNLEWDQRVETPFNQVWLHKGNVN